MDGIFAGATSNVFAGAMNSVSWWEQLEYLFRLVLACLCGGMIGIERQQRTKVAGTRTHMMIALATALMMVISKYGFFDLAGVEGASWDVSRVAAGIISGVGILGGGIIITGKRGYASGLTTAAGIWVTIGIGMALGAGMYFIGVTTTLFMLLTQWILHKNLWIVKQPIKAEVTFHLNTERQAYEKVSEELAKYKIEMSQFKWERKNNSTFQLRCQVLIPSEFSREDIVGIFTGMDEVETFEVI